MFVRKLSPNACFSSAPTSVEFPPWIAPTTRELGNKTKIFFFFFCNAGVGYAILSISRGFSNLDIGRRVTARTIFPDAQIHAQSDPVTQLLL